MNARPLRLFIAAYPPEPASRAMLESLDSIKHRLGVSIPTPPPEQLHLTIQFVGDTPERRLDEVIESLQRSASGIGAFILTPARLITLPEKGPPRLVTMMTDCPPALSEIHRRLSKRLARNPRASDKFLPHITLARFPGEATANSITHDVSLTPFPIQSVRLMRSILKPSGAEHVCIEEVQL